VCVVRAVFCRDEVSQTQATIEASERVRGAGSADSMRVDAAGSLRCGGAGKTSRVANNDAFNNDRQRVLDATDIVRLVGEHCALKPRGREFVCLCPFHDDHSPSMYVVPTKQIYHCFSCGAGGNAIDFVINFHRMPFREALELLANRAGVPLTAQGARRDGDGSKRGPDKADILAANEFACAFFRTIFRHERHGARARAVAERRGFTGETIERFAIGAAPDRWDGLLLSAQRRGAAPAALRAAGLIKDRAQGEGAYDAMRNRLIFPICDQLGRVVAFGGRRLNDEDEPKYLNSPESPLFDKSRTLYGLHLAARSIQRENCVVVTEGYTDAIACHQAGFTHAVATLGTALTASHAQALRRLCDRVILLFDADEAGAKAADRALEVFFAQPVDVHIAVLEGGKDPADLLSEPDGAARFGAALASAHDALEYRFERMRERLAPMGESARARAIEEDIARLVEMGLGRLSPVRWRMVVRRLARVAGVGEEAILAAMPQAGAFATRRVRGQAAARERQRGLTGSALEHALGCLLAAPSLARDLEEEDLARLAPGAMGEAALEAVARAIESALASGVDDDEAARAAQASIEDGEARARAAALAHRVERECDGDPARIERHLRECVRRLRLDALAPSPGPDHAHAHEDRAGVDPEALEANHPSRLDDALEAMRQRQRLGGDHTTMPRPTSAPAQN